ncbi:MAG: zf-HC2 domain-containing protein [Gemmataceae bacterium]|nr:zf-HC2 domain-containing protein [Gemmataceae bacterium]
MTCRELAEILDDFVAGALTEEFCVSIRSHLEICPECLHFVETYQLTIQIGRRLPPAACPEHVIERVRRLLDDQAEP